MIYDARNLVAELSEAILTLAVKMPVTQKDNDIIKELTRLKKRLEKEMLTDPNTPLEVRS